MSPLTVKLEGRHYPIYIGEELLSEGHISSFVSGQQVCIVTNTTIAPLYLDVLVKALREFEVCSVILPDGEKHKSLETVNLIFDELLRVKYNRSVTIVALGGGVIGDMAGFSAACYQRGVNFIQVPTTLLSMVDSSVGGKTGVNHPLGKNMIGAFHQPKAVFIGTAVLKTLPPRELSAGIAEVIKYGLISDEAFFIWLEKNMDLLLAMDQQALNYAIRRSCENKAQVVAEDEKEGGIRAILNLGHTFGHAIETFMGYGVWLHGEAIAAGMVMALDLSLRMGLIKQSELTRLEQLLMRANLPTKAPTCISNEAFIALMGVDKKVQNGRLRLVLLQSFGQAYITDEINIELLNETLTACKA